MVIFVFGQSFEMSYGYIATFRFFKPQDVFLSDKNSLRNFHHPKKNLALRGQVKNFATRFFMGDLEKLAGRPKLE